LNSFSLRVTGIFLGRLCGGAGFNSLPLMGRLPRLAAELEIRVFSSERVAVTSLLCCN
jgi:hypothetical protein